MRKIFSIFVLPALIAQLLSCDLGKEHSSPSGFTDDLCYKNASDNGYLYTLEGKYWLRGGEEMEQRFDITNWSLKPCQLNLNLGREFYPALIEPSYVLASEYTDDYQADGRVICLNANDTIKIYPLQLLNSHIVINDWINGTPVMITYCILSDKAAVYTRAYCDTTFTFAVAGYSYYDLSVMEGTSAFMLWDRETESLWWPLIDKAVSGIMDGRLLVHYDQSKWWESTWGEALNAHPDAMTLLKEQDMLPPENWPRYQEVECK